MKKTTIASVLSISLGLGSAAHAAPMTSATFTILDPTGAPVGVPDTGVTGSIGGGTWSVASTTLFFGAAWTAHSGTTFGPGTYTIPGVGGGTYTNIVVGPGQVGGYILFDWASTINIDVVNVWDTGFTGLCGQEYCSSDVDGDGIPGIGMINGPFPGFNANFDFTVVPVPAAVWLFGSGLLGLIGVARRKKAA